MDKKEVVMLVAKDLLLHAKLTTIVKSDEDRVERLTALYEQMVKKVAGIYDSLP